MQNRDFLQRYRLSLGRNGLPVELHRTPTGSTYRGHEIATGREVAIELIPWAASDPAATAQIEAIAAAAEQIDHPNFPKLQAFGIEEGQLVYVTDYFEGHSAEAWVAGRGPLPLGAVLRVAVQVVSALGAANFHRLHHRAINPANIIFVPGQTAEGEWPAIKLLQRFGPPQDVFVAPGDHAQADTAAHFTSPEQRRGGEVDFASAVYSLGCTIWFLLTGAPPTLPGAEQLRAKVATLRGVPKIVRHLLGRMLSVDPVERPRDPVALQAYLQTCLARADRSQAMRRRWRVIPAARPRAVVARTPREWPVRSLALAALLLLCAALAVVAVPRLLRSRNLKSAQLSAAAVRSELPRNLVKEPAPSEEGPAAQPPIAALTHDEQPALADEPTAAEASPEIAVAPPGSTVSPTAVAAADRVEESAPDEAVAAGKAATAIAAASPSMTEVVAAADQVEESAPNEQATPVEAASAIVVASPGPRASPTAVAAVDQTEESAPNEPTQPAEAASAIVAASPSPTASPTVVAVAENVAPAPHEPIRQPTIAEAQVSEPSPGGPPATAEPSAEIVAAAPVPTPEPTVVAVAENAAPVPHEPIRQPAVAEAQEVETLPDESPATAEPSAGIVAAAPVPIPEPTAAALAKVEEPAPNESSAPAASATPKPEPSVVVARVSTRKKSTRHRAATVAKASHHHARSSRSKAAWAQVRRGRQIPKLRVGSHPAELVGTTSDGRWILSVASSGERVIVSPPPGYAP